ncbi:UDP-glycosyltransferase 91C1 [Heracleum sosnowskyi]|uniref:UDP-glycosyltransferase 91C1 n=1 Tax=Heracleum sosnowskyi TaxID=360622 RepID=A0AAD8HH04_9APIA|nr:UDP-glycosyltransferase 91C1 [Heracleum sosnowskyi]
MESEKALHVVMFPWLAMGHLRPFLHMSKILAQKGHKISFVSTPRNIQRLPKLPVELAPFINFVALALPEVDNLSPHEESSMDIPISKYQLLKIAFDLLKSDLATFLENLRPKPDWIFYDYVSHWLPSLAADLGISTSYLCLFSAACMAFLGAPSFLMSGGDGRLTIEDYTVVPKWVPFPSCVAYHFHEVMRNMAGESGMESGTPDPVRFGASVGGCDLVLLRTSIEFEPEYFNLVCELYQKPVVPIGFLPQSSTSENNDCDEKWGFIKEWLDMQRVNSVVYVALGSEVVLTHEELVELAHGLELCGLPFFWVIREPAWSTHDKSQLSLLPKGFVERVRSRGIVHVGWVPQVKILSHLAVGGFLTHCGWNSVIEALGFGRVLILLPVMNDQGLNSRLLKEKKVGVEIPRNEKNGAFTRDSVVDALRIAMESQEGESLRARAREMRGVFGDGIRNDRYIDTVVTQLVNIRASHLKSDKKFLM